ncbi:MAG: sel1 repeat family protein [Lentisphaeria bacterium]|nr:sel1 repeat family protein [Lentisphaeria bacterium]
MEKYQNIRDLITRGEFPPALEQLEEILEKEPEDLEAQQLHYTCSEVLRIQNTGVGADDEESEMESDEVSVREYLTAYFRQPARKVCRFIFLALSRVPEKWRKKLKADRFRMWEIALTVNADAEKDWYRELLFWNSRRRMTALLFCSGLLLLFTTLFILLALRGCPAAEPEMPADLSVVERAAKEGDPQAQYLLGKAFYEGSGKKRDIDEALLWLSRSSRSGNRWAEDLLQKIVTETNIRTPVVESETEKKNKGRAGGENNLTYGSAGTRSFP